MELQSSLDRPLISVARKMSVATVVTNDSRAQRFQLTTSSLNKGFKTKLYKCMECDYKCKNSYSLTRHARRHHNAPGFKCDVCDKVETEKSKLLLHVQVEHNGKRWICEDCGKQYKSRAALNIHQRVTHTNSALFKCTVCSKTFMSKDIYLGHLSKHEGTKSYSCSSCGKEYRYKNNLILHQSSCCGVKDKTGSKICNFCGLQFSTEKDMKCHINGKHNQLESFSCVCGKRFRWRSSLGYHRNKCSYHNSRNIKKPSSVNIQVDTEQGEVAGDIAEPDFDLADAN